MIKNVVVACFVVVSSLASFGCVAAGDPGSDVSSTHQALQGNDLPVPSIAGTPLFGEYIAGSKELDVQTCNVQHPGMLDPTDPADHPCTAVYPDRHLQVVNVIVVNAKGRIVGDNIHADRPGGGCIHLSIPKAEVGGRVYVVAVGKNLDGSGRKAEQFYYFNLGT